MIKPGEPDHVAIEPKRSVIKAGTLEVDVNHLGFGSIKVDGRPLAGVQEMTIRLRAGHVPRVDMTVLPVHISKATATEDENGGMTIPAEVAGPALKALEEDGYIARFLDMRSVWRRMNDEATQQTATTTTHHTTTTRTTPMTQESELVGKCPSCQVVSPLESCERAGDCDRRCPECRATFPYWDMKAHKAPPTERSIEHLPANADAVIQSLVTLRRNGVLSDEQLSAALGQLEKDLPATERPAESERPGETWRDRPPLL